MLQMNLDDRGVDFAANLTTIDTVQPDALKA